MNTLGIDISGSHTRIVIWNGKKAFSSRTVKTPNTKERFTTLIKELVNTKNVDAVEIAAAGVISGSRIVRAPNIKYLKNFDMRAIVPKEISLAVDNDARCFLRAECATKTSYKAKKILYISFGTGIGRALAENGKIKFIKKFEYPEAWERKYQKIHPGKNNNPLIEFLVPRVSLLVREYKPAVLILAGGVSDRPGMRKAFSKKLPEVAVTAPRKGPYAGAIGAALLVSAG